MTSKFTLRLKTGIAIGLCSGLAACGGGGSNSSVTTPPKVVTTSQEDKFGTQFGVDFRADPNSEPMAVADTDIVPVNLTAEPIDITP